MKVLFLEPYPTEGPSSRYRVEQYIPYLKQRGVECRVRPFVSSAFYRVVYKKGFYSKKILFFLESCIKRFGDLFTAIRNDIVFIHLEAFPIGPPVFERLLAAFLRKKIIYDLDDAIYMGLTSPANKFIGFMKFPSKVKKIINISAHVITSNEYLAEYASKYNKNITVIYTSVDTKKFTPLEKTIPKFRNSENKEADGGSVLPSVHTVKEHSSLKGFTLRDERENKTLIIGWIGSHTTTPYLGQLKNVFRRLSLKYKFELKIVGAGKYSIDIEGIDVINKEWCLNEEVEEFRSLDIGVYPLPDDEWAAGKGAFKSVLYMSVGVPCVASNVGLNKLLIRDGIDGFLAENEDEWVEKLSRLMDDEKLRRRIGLAARKTVEEKYSLNVNAEKMFNIISNTYAGI